MENHLTNIEKVAMEYLKMRFGSLKSINTESRFGQGSNVFIYVDKNDSPCFHYNNYTGEMTPTYEDAVLPLRLLFDFYDIQIEKILKLFLSQQYNIKVESIPRAMNKKDLMWIYKIYQQ